MDTKPIGDAWRIPDELWQRIEPLLPKRRRRKQGGRPPLPARQVMDGIFYGANTHDKCLVKPTLASMPIERPKPTRRQPHHLCGDKGYDYPDVRELVAAWGYTAHIKARGQEQAERQRIPGYRACRWPAAYPVGKESCKLLGVFAFCLCVGDVPRRRGFGIGS